MKINVIAQEVAEPISVSKTRQTAPTQPTGPSITDLSLPMQDALHRFRGNHGVFADVDEYQEWVRRHDPAEEAERLFEHE